jgi:hypothetical protein
VKGPLYTVCISWLITVIGDVCLSDAVQHCVRCETCCGDSYALLKGPDEFVWFCLHLLSAAGEVQCERYNIMPSFMFC